ncbi:MAG: methylmalonyl-CoA epimerase [Candidatus Marinimicrobia bacterium]|jgi:methylmalonyl-CoA epimerase|nr:methylmalonyl-CoA epimerase [Candidatus Neomarinimicrobiota bacterium]MBT3574564.1 methylmalonyl-CoA epimerase [Candidatus Neomarinimicrobiota bacterium]MBT3680468.1 methylmalonyl-CoA epimerase [Candidatus Neomarinimicrobiota bacterium]MBT3951204.1 methylmalonyl-CoA epimerase [Candidatus Neomarinimicrobiota bacterium]MBT4253027.1 methylmalonyl-CoA epimerase [Candidatus Neomarinimicrobiota bacterium]
MKVTGISHIAIAGDNPEQTRILYEDILGLISGSSEVVEQEGVTTHFYKAGESTIELLEPLSAETPVGKFLEKRGPGLHHIALEVEGLDAYVRKLKEAGIMLLSDEPTLGAHDMRIIFIHPKSAGGVLIELCEHQ